MMKTDSVKFFLVPAYLASIIICLGIGLKSGQEIMIGNEFHCCGLDEYHT